MFLTQGPTTKGAPIVTITPTPSTLRSHRFKVAAAGDPHEGEFGSSIGTTTDDRRVLVFGPEFTIAAYFDTDLVRGCGCPTGDHADDCRRPCWACPLCDSSDDVELTVTRTVTATPRGSWPDRLVVTDLQVAKGQDQPQRLRCRPCDHTYDVPTGLEITGL
jgi:hypothetical protein